jgi:hypothetical protein
LQYFTDAGPWSYFFGCNINSLRRVLLLSHFKNPLTWWEWPTYLVGKAPHMSITILPIRIAGVNRKIQKMFFKFS